MNHPAARLLAALFGVVLFGCVAVNKWINKELRETVMTPVEVPRNMPPSTRSVKPIEYDLSSDYPIVPSEDGDALKPEKPKKSERVPDEKIIYEMPTTNKFLLQ